MLTFPHNCLLSLFFFFLKIKLFRYTSSPIPPICFPIPSHPDTATPVLSVYIGLYF